MKKVHGIFTGLKEDKNESNKYSNYSYDRTNWI